LIDPRLERFNLFSDCGCSFAFAAAADVATQSYLAPQAGLTWLSDSVRADSARTDSVRVERLPLSAPGRRNSSSGEHRQRHCFPKRFLMMTLAFVWSNECISCLAQKLPSN